MDNKDEEFEFLEPDDEEVVEEVEESNDGPVYEPSFAVSKDEDDIFKLEGERLYLPIVLNEFDSENYEISVEYVLSEKVDQNDRIGMYEDYTEPKVYIEKYEYNYDENISRYYIDGVRLDKDKTVFLTVNVYGEGINQMLFGFSY